MPTITYTKVDEAPALATYSLFPIMEAFTERLGISVEPADISLAARIISAFKDRLKPEQRLPDALSRLGGLTKSPQAVIIKLPNISASVPQLLAAVRELQGKGYDIPDYPEGGDLSEDEKAVREVYSGILGSAVNPVLRNGNSDRRCMPSVKACARKTRPRLREWDPGSKSHVASMSHSDFFGTEKSVTFPHPTTVDILFSCDDGSHLTLKKGLKLGRGDILDAAVMRANHLRAYYDKAIADAKDEGLLLSLHLKATMMKVSDPVMFGHCVAAFYEPVLSKHAEVLENIGFNVNNGISDLYGRLSALPRAKQDEICADIAVLYKERPPLAMVDSNKGVTHLHRPNNVIVDASIPQVIQEGGRCFGPDGSLHQTKALIPDRSYAEMYQAVFEDCQAHGAFDPSSMGSVSNVGLMAHKAEEYGSHDKTFILEARGKVSIVDSDGSVLMEHNVQRGDIYRACQTSDAAVRDWVKLAVSRARATGDPSVFWLDEKRSHHAELLLKVRNCLRDHETADLDIQFMAPLDAMKFTLNRTRKGLDTITVTGNVLRDYLTDLFPILELGTSSRMLSIVPLMSGGGLFETGAGGSAPRLVEQFIKDNHLSWDSLGEFLAFGAAFEYMAERGCDSAKLLAGTLDKAISRYLTNRRSPSFNVGELDTRGSHFYFCLYWALALATHHTDAAIRSRFSALATVLEDKEQIIMKELQSAQGSPVDLGGYFKFDDNKASLAMRPSPTLNSLIEKA